MVSSTSFPIRSPGEKSRILVRAEAFNTFNHVSCSGFGTTLNSGSEGRITSVREPRHRQLSLRFEPLSRVEIHVRHALPFNRQE